MVRTWRFICGVFLLIAMTASCGCLQESGQQPAQAPDATQAVVAVQRFMNDSGYSPGNVQISMDRGTVVMQADGAEFSIDPSGGEVTGAAFSGRTAMDEVIRTHHYEMALSGIREFLQDPGFSYNFTGFQYGNDRYVLSAANVTFRVNATSGAVTQALLQGPEGMGILNSSLALRNMQESAGA